jgi:hypothetical protein
MSLRTLLASCCAFLSLMERASAAAVEPPWHSETGCRWMELRVPAKGKTGFTQLSPSQTGIDFTNNLAEFSGATNRILYNGAGLALGDFDHDGRVDIFACGLDSPSALYRNLGDWKFTNITAVSGLRFADPYQRGAVFADINGDGWLDLLVSTLNKGVLVFLNDGHGHFSDFTAEAGTASGHGSVTMALADIDGNGTLDLYIANNRSEDIRNRGRVQVYMRNGQYVIPNEFKDRLVVIDGVVREYGEPDVLMLNDGKGHFTPVSWIDGRFLDEQGQKLKHPPLDWGQTVAFRDINGDGAPDIYVCNDYWTPDRLWLNDGKGNFRAIDWVALRHIPFSSMGVDFGDIDRDGNVDFFVTDMQSRDHRLRKRQIFAFNPMKPILVAPDRPQIMHNTLFLNRGDTTFTDIANYAGVASSDWAWQQIFLDVDLDGFEDILISAGYFRDVQDLDAIARIDSQQKPITGATNESSFQEAFSRQKMQNARLFPPYLLPIIAFRNLGNLKFQETTSVWGTDQLAIRHGMAAADLDNDGTLDLVANVFNGPLGVYRNDTVAPRVAVRLKGGPPNTQGIGAKVKLLNGAVPLQSQEMTCGGRYLSGGEALLVFAAGKSPSGMTLEVTWRNGRVSRVEGVGANRIYEVEETGAAASPAPPALSASPPLFEDVSATLGHTHHEEAFDDFARQPLLPRKLSQPGPGVAWWDLDGDGHEDLIIGSGKSGATAVYLGDGKGGFKPALDAQAALGRASRDQTGLLGMTRGGKGILLTGLANYEDGQSAGEAVNQWVWGSTSNSVVASADGSSVGPLALADIDGDGELELFVGGRVSGGRWPEPASSRIFRRSGEKWVADEANTRALAQVGLVSGALWSDLDGDSLPELILGCEWGPVRIFRNQGGKLAPWNPAVIQAASPAGSGSASTPLPLISLNDLTGWWNGVTTGDLDGDGRLDIIASNWGLNSGYEASPEHPAEVYYGDLGGLGVLDVVEAEYEPELNAIAPRRYRDPLMASLPFIAAKFPTHKAFSEATLGQVLGEAKNRAKVVRATTLASVVFLNRGDKFEVVAMPAEAQFSPGFGVAVADLDGDGNEDVLMSQNFFANEPSTPRSDAGRGLVMLGDGKGGLRALPGQVSGIRVYGEQRGLAVGDFDEDGRVDVALGQNGGATRLFRNLKAKPGLRVTLAGPPGNPGGVGAVVRLKAGERYGPAREVHAGSGYTSQDSPVPVMGSNGEATAVWVRWPGGKVTEGMVPKGARSVRVSSEGHVGPE